MLSNDNDETQYTDQLEMWVVDKDRGVMPRVGSDGSMHSVREPVAPLTARDGQGKDLMTWLAKRDGLIWEPPPAEQRQEVVLTFPKRAGCSTGEISGQRYRNAVGRRGGGAHAWPAGAAVARLVSADRRRSGGSWGFCWRGWGARRCSR
jgi:hypothetical protein